MVCRGIPNFLIFDPKDTLWVLIRCHSNVPTMYVLRENIKNIKTLPMKFSFFSSEKKKKFLYIAWASFHNANSESGPLQHDSLTSPSQHHMSCLMRKPTIWFLNRSDTNRPVQSRKNARNLKFWISKEGGLYYLCSENKGANQLRGYREADLRLCFRLSKLLVFS